VSNDVHIYVRSHNDTRAGFDSARTDVKRWADESAAIYTERMTLHLRRFGRSVAPALTTSGQQMGGTLGDSTSTTFSTRFLDTITRLAERSRSLLSRAGERIGQRIGSSAADRITEEINNGMAGVDGRTRDRAGGSTSSTHTSNSGGMDQDRDRNRFSNWIRSAARAGLEAGQRFGDRFAAGIQSFFAGDVISILIKSLIAAPLVAAIAVPLAAAVTSAIMLALGGGVIALGVAAAFKDPRIQAAGGELKDRIGKLFEKFGEPFRGPVASFLEKLAGFIDSLAPDMERIANIFAPIAQQLGDGIIGLLQNAMPGILRAVERAAPFIETLANRLPEIGEAIGKFFDKISGQGDDALVFFNDLLTLVIKLIGFIGNLIAAFTSAYANIRRFVSNAKDAFMDFLEFVLRIFGRILDGASAALSWIPGIGGKLAAAKGKFSAFRKDVNAELARIRDREVRIRVRVIGLAAAQAALSVANQLNAMGYASGGIKGAASGMVAGGLTWVGERGPELVQLPTGSTVRSSGDSMRMMRDGARAAGQQGGGVLQAVGINPALERTLIGVLLSAIRWEIGQQGGDVQQVLGRAY
jgi:ABC-type transporter Mla subunit MlaD